MGSRAPELAESAQEDHPSRGEPCGGAAARRGGQEEHDEEVRLGDLSEHHVRDLL